MNRKAKKLLLASAILVIGVALAWPFRRTAESPGPVADQPLAKSTVEETPSTQTADTPAAVYPLASEKVAASLASTSTAVAQLPQPTPADDPTLPTPEPASMPGEYVASVPLRENNTPRPVYATVSTASSADGTLQPDWPEERTHEIQNGDTLAKLAKYYLGDAGRALEIFDLNRDKLANPHLLPIGAELRIPAADAKP